MAEVGDWGGDAVTSTSSQQKVIGKILRTAAAEEEAPPMSSMMELLEWCDDSQLLELTNHYRQRLEEAIEEAVENVVFVLAYERYFSEQEYKDSDHFKDIAGYFSKEDFEEISDWEKLRYTNMKWNYEAILAIAVVSGQWSAGNPGDVTTQNGLCARIPCHYRHPSNLNNEPWTGIWFNSDTQNKEDSVAFHSGDRSLESPKFRHRTRLSGILRNNDCSLGMDNVTQQDAGPYFFRVEFTVRWIYNYHPVTQLSVTDFTDKPTIFPAEMVAGQPVNVTCIFNTTCNGMAPTLTWATPADEPPSASHSVTQQGDTQTYTSVLYLTPAPKHHGQNLTCRVTYPTVSSEQILTMTVQLSGRDRTGKCVVAVIVLAVFLGVSIITITMFWAACCRNKRESSVTPQKEQKAEDEPVESPYQELNVGDRDLYSKLKLRSK